MPCRQFVTIITTHFIKAMSSFLYSPHPIESYYLTGLNGLCEAGSIHRLVRSEPVWNLFWLSTPNIDNVVGAGASWHNKYMPVKSWAAALTADVLMDDILSAKLCMHPSRFAAWWRFEDHTIYDAYDICGGEDWVLRVRQRAEDSAQRLAADLKSPVLDMILGKREV